MSVREMKQWVEQNPGETLGGEMPTSETFGAPPTFVGESTGYLTITERRANHRDALEQKYREHQFNRKQNQVAHLRAFYS